MTSEEVPAFARAHGTAVNTMAEYKYWKVRELEGNDDCGG
jgi:hypothetical protein